MQEKIKLINQRLENALNIIKLEQVTVDSCNEMLNLLGEKKRMDEKFSGTVHYENGKIIDVKPKSK